jgi:vancomycin aglycone glucosyltransferase
VPAHPSSEPTADSLRAALHHALDPDVAATAQAVAGKVRTDGALIAAQRLTETSGP